MSSRGKKRKRGASPSSPASEGPPIQKLRIKPIPELPSGTSSSGKKHGKKSKGHESPIPATSISPTEGDDGGLKMKFILSPKKMKVEASPSSDTPEESSPQKGKGKKKEKLKAKLFFEDQVLTLDGETVTHEEMQSPGKKRKSSATLSDMKQSPDEPKSGKKKKKDSDKVKVKDEPVIPPFTKVPKSADRPKAKTIKTESDSGYSDTPTSGKAKKHKAKLQTLAEHPAPSPQASDVLRDSAHKKKKKDKDKKKKKMFKFKGDRNRFLNVRDSSDEDGDDSLSRSYVDEDSLGGAYDVEDEKSKDMDRFMMPQMPVPDYNLEKQAAAAFNTSPKGKARKEERKEREIQSSRAEDLISQLTAYGSEMETIYPSYMLAPESVADPDDGWIKKKKKKKKLMKEKKKKKKLKGVERDEQGNVKYVIRKTKLSGYMLWCRSYRSTFVSQNPGLDFSTISRRMGALWQTLPIEEKNQWRQREITVNTRVPASRLDKGERERWEAAAPFRLKTPDKSKSKAKKLAAAAAAAVAASKKKSHAKKKPQTPVKITPPKWNPIDCAAYLRLLGESLSGVGGKLKTHKKDNIEVHGSISVLLDSMLCAMGPLLCLTEQVPAINCITKKTKTSMLDNIAYIMPGL